MLSQLILEVYSGILGDIFNKKKVVILGLILLTITTLLTISSTLITTEYIYYILIVIFVLEGVGNAFLSGADDALFLKH